MTYCKSLCRKPRKETLAERALGFTIIELSIVVAIIALVIGGIWVGQSMIRRSELQSIIADAKRYTVITKQFRDKYKYLPGDMPDAENYWGTDPDGCPDAGGDTDLRTETCNGDGNGQVGNEDVTAFYERFRYWQHLADAGFIDKMFSGGPGPVSSTDVLVGINVPLSQVNGVGFLARYIPNGFAGSAHFFAGDYKHFFLIGRQSPAGGVNNYPFMTPAEAAAIDGKEDDGQPGKGGVKNYKSTAPNASGCTTTDDPDTAEYNTGDSTINCALLVLMGF